MKRKLTRLLIISCLLALGSLNSVAQEKKPGQVELKVPTDGTFKVLWAKPAFGKVVKGAPYTATATTENIQTLNDGNQIIHKNQSKLYRDSEGRTRMEQTLETIGKWTAEGEALQIIIINDPVAGMSYSLDPRTRTAYKGMVGINVRDAGDLAERARLDKLAQEKLEALKRAAPEKLEAEKQAALDKAMAQKQMMLEANRGKPGATSPTDDASLLKPRPVTMPEGTNANGSKKTGALGKQVIEGVEAEGTRTTVTIPAGEIGNTLPIEVVDETWYSPELQLMVMSKHRDPRSGETTYRLININRSEPDRTLFEIPADYTVRENTLLPKPKPTKKPTKEEQ